MGKPDMPARDFDDFLTERNDALTNTAHGLALEMLHLSVQPTGETVFPWNMEIIGAILESTQEILQSHGYAVCWPYHEDDVPCYQTASCMKTDCLMKGRPTKEGESNETN